MKSNNIVLSFMTINDLPFVINNWYFKAYCKIISNALKESRKKLKQNDPQYVYYESHHIHPKSLGGSNDKDNLVLLTKHEHFIIHWLLTKCISGKEKYSMMRAFDSMFMKSKYHKERHIPKHKFAKIIKQNREGFKHSEETIEKYTITMNNKSPEEKADSIRKQKETNTNKSEEEKLEWYLSISKSLTGKSRPDVGGRNSLLKKGVSNPKISEAKAFKYTQEESDFILQKRALGLSFDKITKAFNERFNKNISRCAIQNYIRNNFIF